MRGILRHLRYKSLETKVLEWERNLNVSGLQLRDNFWAQIFYVSVSQPPGRGPVPGPGINYTGPREVLLEFVILVF